jgi:hypothetical protein
MYRVVFSYYVMKYKKFIKCISLKNNTFSILVEDIGTVFYTGHDQINERKREGMLFLNETVERAKL